MHPHLRALSLDFERNTAEFRALTSLPPEALTRKPDPRRWSVLEVIEHLRVTGDLYYPLLEEAVDAARGAGGDPSAPFRPSLFARLFVHMAGPNSRLRLKAPALFKPAPAFEDVAALPRFLKQQPRLGELITRADGCNLNQTKFPSPISARIRFTIGSGLTLMVRHQQRHLLQIGRLRAGS
ncbi:MAG: DinB family protein [Planctomycetota bacterium]